MVKKYLAENTDNLHRKIKYYKLIWFKYDLPAGLSVFLVALPLCLGIALASGAPLYAGIVSGIIGGLVVSLISGSPLAVSGPAAGLTTIVAATIISTGDYRVFLLSVIIAGVFQLLLGTLKLGGIANYFPSAVIKGMLAAIGILLISKQIPIAVGYDQPDFWASGFLKLFSKGGLRSNFYGFGSHITVGVIAISVSCLVLVAALQKVAFFKKIKFIPSALLVVCTGIMINLLLSQFAPQYALKAAQLVSIPSNVFNSISLPAFNKFFETAGIWKNGIIIGLLATLETLLCVEAIDKLDKHNRITPVNRELVAQGIGNIVCGILGAIPITAVIVRGAANVDAGARTKLSSFTHGLFLLLAVVAIPFVLNMVPYAALSAILLVTGYNLTRPKLYRNMWQLGARQFLPFVITIVVILATDLLVGVSIGLLISIYFIVQNNFKAEYKLNVYGQDNSSYCIKLNTNVTFLNKVNLKKVLDEIPENTLLTIDGSDCNFIDYDILEIISEFDTKAYDRNITLALKGIKKVNVTAIH